MNNLLEKYKSFPVQVKASFWFLICAFLQKGISILTTPIFSRLLTTIEYGQYNVFNSWLGIATVFISLNLSWGVYTQGLVKYEEEKNVYTSSLEGLSTTLVFIWTLIYLISRNFWNNLLSLTTVQMLAMLIMIWTTAVINFWASEQRVVYKYKALVIITLAVTIVKPALGIFFVLHAEDKVTARILGIVLVEIIGYAGLYFAQMHRGKQFFNAKFWKYAIIYNLPLVPHYLAQTVLNSADRIMISNMIGDSEAGIYSLAYSLAGVMALFNSALMQTLNPWIYQKIKAKRIKDIELIAYISLILIAAVNLLLILLAPEAVSVFAPKAYHDAIWVIPPVAISVYFTYSYDLFAKFAFYYEKTNLIMMASMLGAVLNVILNLIFINLFGYKAAGYTTLACYMIYSIGHYIFMNKVCDVYCDGVRPYSTIKILTITFAFMTAGFILLFTYNYTLIRYGIIVATMVVSIIKRKKIMEVGKELISLKKG